MAAAKAAYDVIVIGAGIEGSSSAYNLVKKGKKVLLLEQFPLPHSRGSSHGQSRIIRYAYEEDFYVKMMVDAFPLWKELEEESGAEFYIKHGLFEMHQEDSQSLQNIAANLRAFKVQHEMLTPADVKSRFPAITAGDKCGGIWDPNGGVLKADRALAAYQTVFKRLGGTLRDGEPVTLVTPGDVVTVSTRSGQYTASSLVIAAGAWSGRFCSALGLNVPLDPLRTVVLYWKVINDGASDYAPGKFPCFIDSRTVEDCIVYGFPMQEYPGLVKACLHYGAKIDPDERDKVVGDEWIVEKVKNILASTFKNLESTPSIKEYCIYTNTPDNHAYIDKHPKYPNIVIATGFSGHGFKIAPAVGRAVSELVLKQAPTYNMKPFQLDRFSRKASL
ncbi:unnamed protein product [Lymnaea stagnalis]|uniref:sarcosine oxidasee (formaldehyde-forming) n=1 Tax=Lymnaea stagnalis TaxID=6523 RepID=A0AAV2IND7_LYMST